MMRYILFAILFSQTVFSDQIDFKKLDWNGVEVYWVEDDAFPSYAVSIFFSDGALSDQKGKYGETEFMFSAITDGTNRYSQKQVSDNLDYFGTRYDYNVTHEYSSFTFGGLSKDIIPTAKMFCHLFKKAIFPKRELNNAIKRAKSDLNNLITNHSSLASIAFRRASLQGTPYEYPTSGIRTSLGRINRKDLIQKLNRFNTDVKKVVYITGPKSILDVEKVFLTDCKWSGEANYSRADQTFDYPQAKKRIVLVSVPKSNQAQIRLGSYFKPQKLNEKFNLDQMTLLSSMLGGSFSSLLMQELRVKRGLTYSAGSFIVPQRKYGRTVVSTFTPTNKVTEAIEVIQDVFNTVNTGSVAKEKFEATKKYLAGNYLFQFETSESFLGQLQYYKHIGRDFDEIFKFPKNLEGITMDQIQSLNKTVFNWDDIIIVVVGDVSLKQSLMKFGKVEVVNYKSLL